ncbi:MAG: NERD domain-containing protein [Akkermansia sp.]|nr:NERD domain-containing protein [Akkermansia sp.]
MAQLHSRIPVQNMQRGERLVYDAMACLPRDWVIFHSCKEDYLDDNRYVHYEADFVVLVPGRGLIVIEVKDWPHIRIQHGRWESRQHRDAPWKQHVHSPLEQANIALQKIMRSLVHCGCLPKSPQSWPEHRHMAILTQGDPVATACGNLPFESLYLCGAAALAELQQRLESLFILNQPERMSDRRVQKIADTLAPSVHFQLSIANYLQEMDMAAAHLLELLPALSDSEGGIRVEGCAGSGKTVMACAEAARLAAEAPLDGKHHVLMLCFNHAMADELLLHPLLSEQSETMLVSTFHDFCIRHILKPAGFEHLVNYSGEGDRLPEDAMQKIAELLPGVPHYDAIFVDEAQDFRSSWWQVIRALLTPDGRFYIFGDKNQDLYDRYDQMPELPTRLNLTRNLRNACQIAGFSRAMLPPADQHCTILPMSGAGVTICPPADSARERAALVQDIIRQLLQGDAQIQRRDIVVLSPWRPAHPRCCLNLVPGLATATAEESPDQAAKRRSDCRKAGAESIFASTVKSFKGQEAAYVIVADIIGLGESRGFDMKELYTACTRARYGLYLVPSTTGKALLEQFPTLFTP